MKYVRPLSLLVLPLLVLACDRADTPAGPEIPDLPIASSIVDGSSPDGLDGFYFRPPIVEDSPQGEGEFDASLLDLLAVEICEWTGDACVMPLVERITSESPHPAELTVVGGAGYYRALWETEDDDLDPARTYRIRVVASGGELGHADVDVLEDGEEPAEDMVPLKNGDGLPIAFRVEEGLGERVGSGGGTIVLADGQVSIEIPEGALPGDVFITASPATDLPPPPPEIVEGTAWDFGPDGLEFEEPVVLTIGYDPANLPPGTDESELRIHELVDGMYVQADAGLVDLENKTLSALVDGFSIFVGLRRQFRGSREDVTAPVIQSVEVQDPATGTFGSSATLELGSMNVDLPARFRITDDISGVQGFNLRYGSPSGGQIVWMCTVFSDPTTGSDTNGSWDCSRTWLQYAEAGTWQPQFLTVQDKVGNRVTYSNQAGGFCGGFGADAHCIADMPAIDVVSDPSDTEPPVVASLEVSPDTDPRIYGSSTSVDVGATGRFVVFGFQATDDLSGVGRSVNQVFFFGMGLRGPSGQSRLAGCTLDQGNALDGFWECRMFLPQLSEAGTWEVSFLNVTDRANNVSSLQPDGTGQLCDPDGNCVAAPTVEVTSAGDMEAPFLEALNISVDDVTVTITMDITDDLSGVSFANPRFNSATTTQFQSCFTNSPIVGTSTDGTFQCSFTFPEHSALGDWFFSLSLGDAAGNRRFYSRRASDGFLCYFDQGTSTQVCEDFGDTDIVVR